MEKLSFIFQNPYILMTFLFLVSFTVFYWCFKLAFKVRPTPPREPLFSDEEINSLCRVNNLFEDVPLHNGHEWKDLPVDNLIAICVEASEIVGKVNERSKKRFLIQTAERAEDLSSWMRTNSKRDFYRDSNMSYLIEKPRILAFSLRSLAGDIV